MIPPFGTGVAGENGLYGGQIAPCVQFLTSLIGVAAHAAVAGSSNNNGLEQYTGLRVDSSMIWGVFLRLVALTYALAFASLRGQVLGLSGERGLFPAAPMLQRARHDFPNRLWRWAHFPAGWLWLSCSDTALRATCTAGILAACAAALGVGGCSPLLLFACWAIWVMLGTACGASLGYPWDCLLAEIGFLCAMTMPQLAPLLPLLAPPLLAPRLLASSPPAAASPSTSSLSLGLAHGVSAPCACAVWTTRLLLVRVVLGMGKMKFSTGWAVRMRWSLPLDFAGWAAVM